MTANTIIYQPIFNKYHTWYESICRSRQILGRARRDGNYYENHHIIPQSLGGSNTKENMVFLTAKEHFTVHRLLPKFLKGIAKAKMWNALDRMRHSKNSDRYNISASTYNLIRLQVRKALSEQLKGQPNGRLGTHHSLETRQKISLANRGKVSWIKGKHLSIEIRGKISTSNKGKIMSDEAKQKMRLAKLGKPSKRKGIPGKFHTSETKEKMKHAQRNRRFIERNVA